MKKFFLFFIFIFFWTKSFCVQKFFLKDFVWNIKNKSSIFLYQNIIFKKYGFWITKTNIDNLINVLYKIGCFRNIKIYQKNNKIFIYLYYNPLIDNILISGNKLFKKKDVFNILNKFNIKKNKYLNNFLFLKIKNYFIKRYMLLNKYNVKINFWIFFLKNKHCILKINFNENKYLNIRKIFFKNNNYLIKDLFVSKNYYFNNFWNILMDFNLNKFIIYLNFIKNFYFNSGYLDFNIKKIKFVFLNKSSVNIYIDIYKGKRYKIYDLLIYNKNIEFDSVINKIKYKFFYKNIYYKHNILKNIYFNLKNFFRERGFLDVNINFDYQKIYNNKIIIFLYINSGKIFHINKIYFKDISLYERKILYYNNIPWLKDNIYNEYLINLSKQNLKKTNFFTSIVLKLKKKYLSKINKLDIIYYLEKNYDKNINFGINYGENNFLNYTISLFKKNFLYLGNDFLFKSIKNKFDNYNKFYIVNYINYLHNIYIKHKLFYNNSNNDIYNFINFNYGYKSNIVWKINNSLEYKFGINYVFNNFFFNKGYNFLKLNYFKYINKNIKFIYQKKNFIINDFLITNNFIINKLDNIILPKYGYYINFNNKFTFLNSYNNFYKIDIFWSKYISLTKYSNWILLLRNYIGYSNSFKGKKIPFYESYYFLNNNYLRVLSQNNYLDKFYRNINLYKNKNLLYYYNNNLSFYFTNELILPNSFFLDKYYSKYWRISLFIDSGFMLNTTSLSKFNIIKNILKNVKDNIKVSTGIAFKFVTPMGIVNLSYGLPLLYNNNDIINNFQFSIGNNF